MNKEEFVAFLANEYSITKKAAEDAINLFTKGVIKAIENKQKVHLVNFGSFYTVHIKSRKGVNPKTREEMTIAAYNQAGFKAGQRLKDAANKE